MGVLLLLRHGQAALGEGNYDSLSLLGVRQAQLAGVRLARGPEIHNVRSGGSCGNATPRAPSLPS